MKVRTSLELEEFIHRDIAIVKKEFTNLNFLVKEEKRAHIRPILVRSSILLLYSHWEGHIKRCSSAYLKHLSTIGIPLFKMNYNFILLMARDNFKEGFSLQKQDCMASLYDYIKFPPNINFSVDEKNFIQTRSNLNFDNFKEIVNCLGFDLSKYELKENLINEKLVKKRHAIAHGDFTDIAEIQICYDEVKEDLLDIITMFDNMISNSVSTKSYLHPSYRP